jgi:HlyD family secretion protein
MNRPSRIPIVVAVVMFSLAIGVALQGTIAGARGGDDRTIRESGRLEYIYETDIRSEAGCPLPIVYIAPEGKPAKKGSLLAELDAAPLAKELNQQTVEVEKAQARLAVAEASHQAARTESKAMVEVAEQALVVAEGALKVFTSDQGEYQLKLEELEREIKLTERRHQVATRRAQRLSQYVDSLEKQSEREEAQLAALEAELELASAQARLAFLRKTLLPQKTAELKLAIAQSKLELIRAKAKVSMTGAAGEAALLAERANYEAEKNRLASLEKQIAACKIHAPRDGTVVYPHDALWRRGTEGEPKRGTLVEDRQVLFQLVDMTRMQLVARVGLAVAQKVSPGQRAAVRVDAFPQVEFEGRVTNVAVVSAPRPREPNEGAITVRIDDPEGRLRAGMSAMVELDL